jgi:hypothetical protein
MKTAEFTFIKMSSKVAAGAAITSLKASIASRAATLKSDCHIALVSTLMHWEKYQSGTGKGQEIEQVIDLITASLGNSQGQAAMQYVHDFTIGLFWNEKTKVFITDKDTPVSERGFKKTVSGVKIGKTETYSGDPKQLAFWKLQRPVVMKPFDLEKSIKSLIDKVLNEDTIPMEVRTLVETSLKAASEAATRKLSELKIAEIEKGKAMGKKPATVETVAKPDLVKAQETLQVSHKAKIGTKTERDAVKIKSLADLATIAA